MKKQMKKQILSFSLVFALIVGALMFQNIALAQDTPLQGFTKAIEGTETERKFQPRLEKFEGRPHELSSVEPGAEVLTTVIFRVIDFLKYLLGGIAIIYITIGGVRLIASGGNIEEVSKKQKANIMYILMGLFLTIVADTFVKEVFFGEYGECLAGEANAQACAEQGALQIRGIYNFIQIFVATIAVLMLVISGFRLIASAGDEETIGKQKKHIGYAIAGLVLVGISEFVVKEIIFTDSGAAGIDPAAGIHIVSRITNFVSAFVGTLSIIFLIYGGWMYVASFGNQEKTDKAKKIILGAFIGLLIAFAAFGVVRTILSIETFGEPPDIQPAIQNTR